MKEKKPIVILSPMDCETDLLFSLIDNPEKQEMFGRVIIKGEINEYPVIAIRSLIGIVNNAFCATLAAEKFNPCCIILQGTAGAHNPALSKNDIVIANKTVSLASYVTPKAKMGDGTNPFSWENYGAQTYFENTGKTDFVKELFCDERLVNIALSTEYKAGKLISGTVAAGDMWNKENDLILHYNKIYGTDCEAMEGFSVAQICAGYNLPMVEIRIISNCELKPDEPFSKNVTENCQKYIYKFIENLTKKIKNSEF